MNILYLSADRGIPVLGHKGAAVHVRAIANAFARAGHTVTVMTPSLGPQQETTLAATIIEVPLPSIASNGTARDLAREHQAQAYNAVLLTAALQHLQQQPADFIYERTSLWSDVGARLAERTGLPLVLEVNAPLRLEAERYRHLFDAGEAARVEAAQFAAAEAIIVVSAALRDYVIGQGAPASRVHVLPNGIDPHHFHPAVRGGAVHARHQLDGKFIVGFVGRPRPWHDLQTLLHAMQLLRQEDEHCHLLLVGQMPDDLPARLVEMGLDDAATLVPPVAHHEVPHYIAAMDVAVSPHLPQSHSYFSPLKLFEYLACGVPTVAANIGQSAAIIREGQTGLLYTPGDERSLAEKIRTLRDNPAFARSLAWHGAETVLEKYTWDQNAQTVLALVTGQGEQVTEAIGPELPIRDHKLRQRLYRATRPDLALPLIARAIPPARGEACFRPEAITAVDILKYKPGRRCVLRYALRSRTTGEKGAGSCRLIGKVFRDDRGRRLHALQENLWRHGFGPEAADAIFVPRPLGYVAKMRMQLQADAPGLTLNELLLERDITPLMPRAAQALAKLHNWFGPVAAVDDHHLPLKRYLLEEEVQNLGRFAANLAAERAPEAARVSRLHSSLLAWARDLPASHPVKPIHRDYYYSQLLFDGDTVTMIDFDLFSLGDPALDVANFHAHLTFLGMDLLADKQALSAAADLFLGSYHDFVSPDATFDERFAFYQAATFFRLLNVVAPRPGLVHLFDELFEHTAALLARRLVGEGGVYG